MTLTVITHCSGATNTSVVLSGPQLWNWSLCPRLSLLVPPGASAQVHFTRRRNGVGPTVRAVDGSSSTEDTAYQQVDEFDAEVVFTQPHIAVAGRDDGTAGGGGGGVKAGGLDGDDASAGPRASVVQHRLCNSALQSCALSTLQLRAGDPCVGLTESQWLFVGHRQLCSCGTDGTRLTGGGCPDCRPFTLLNEEAAMELVRLQRVDQSAHDGSAVEGHAAGQKRLHSTANLTNTGAEDAERLARRESYSCTRGMCTRTLSLGSATSPHVFVMQSWLWCRWSISVTSRWQRRC